MKGIVSTRDFEEYHPSVPLLSSLREGWEGVTLRAYDEQKKEQKEAEQVIFPAVPDISLILVTQGTTEFEYREDGGPWETLQVSAGDWSLVPGTGQPYELRCHALSAEPLESLLIHVNTDFMARMASPLISNDLAHVEISKRLAFQDPLLTQIGLALQQELYAPTAAGKLYAETAAQMLAVHLLRHYAQIASTLKEKTSGLTQQQVKRVLEYIQHHLDQNLSLAEIAQQSGLSPFHFARRFRQTTGESPHQYVVNRRIETAQRLLKETDLSVGQIALMTGFASQGHFTQAFTRRLGQPPRQYRLRRS
ncbi:MAG TPA: AraC family transcriptional regulator [Ktedonobacteraceae bacterium]|jgi:AraC family transcriptional regulator